MFTRVPLLISAISFLLLVTALVFVFRRLITRLLRTQDHVRLVNMNRSLLLNIEERRKTQLALREAEAKYRGIFENAVEGIIQTSADGKFLDSNPAFAAMLGYSSPKELLETVHDISTQVYVRPSDRQIFRTRVEAEGVAKMEYEARKKDGTTVWLSVSARAVRNEEGRLLYFESIAEDVTARRKTEEDLRESRERLEAALEASETGTFCWRISTDEFNCDASLRTLIGATRDEKPMLLGDFGSHIVEDDREDTLRIMRECAQTKKYLHTQFRTTSPDRGVRWLLAKGKVFSNDQGDPSYMTGACSDITQRRLAEKSLRASEERYRSLVAATSSIIWTSAPDGAFTAAQPSWERYTGQKWPEYGGFGWLEMIQPDDLAYVQSRWAEYQTDPRPFQFEGRVWNAETESFRTFECRAVPLITSSGKAREWVGTMTDIHEQKKAQVEERKFKFISDNANDAYFLANRRSQIVYVNRVACELLGYTSAELTSLSLSHIEQAYDPSKFEQLFVKSRASRNAPFETSLVRRDGKAVPVEISVSRFTYGNESYLFSVARDITERKAVEESLRNHAEELARSNRELEQFAFVASHDLKEPLRMVTVYVQLLQNHLNDHIDDQAKEYLRYAVHGSQRMQSLIHDLLSYSKLSKELGPYRTVNCSQSLQSAMQNLRSAIDESGARINIGALPEIQGNSSQITQLFQNLIANAIKFRGTRPPEIDISAKKGDGVWVFSVKDNGIGIHSRYLKRIFVIFQRLHTGYAYPGTGIGLSICKKIVENHGGTIWAESQLGEGSIFCFALPIELGARVPDDSKKLGPKGSWSDKCADRVGL